ncbi:MAG: GNAT family N-acetyltransferase [Bacteroidota bacterium]
MIYQKNKGDWFISTDKSKLDITVINTYLANAYWAIGRSENAILRSIEGSMCFGMYHQNQQVGFARAMTDKATFAYMVDVFILPKHQGNGLGKWLVETILSHPELQNINWLLKTKDAHGLYAQFGFTVLTDADLLMHRLAHQPY